MQAGAGAIEIAGRQFDQLRRVHCNERILGMRSADPRGSRVDRRLPPDRGQIAFGSFDAPLGLSDLLEAALRPPFRVLHCGGGILHRVSARKRIRLGAIEGICVLHRRVRTQRVQLGLRTSEGDLARLLVGTGVVLFGLRLLEFGLRFVPRPAGVIEFSLCLPQNACLPAALRARIDPVTLFESLDGSGESLEILELAAVFLQLTECFGHVAEQFGRKRR
jgi:hypothetical protein